jgi:hypothetical protein
MLQQQTPVTQLEPARKLYVLGKGWTDLRASQVTLNALAQTGAQHWLGYIRPLNTANLKTGCVLIPIFYPIILFCLIMSAISYIFMILAFLLFTLFDTAFLALGAGLCLAAISVLRFINWLYISIWRINYDCPNPYCYERRPLPIFKCSHCQAEHQRLRPNIYGIWTHRCQCGTKLHTMERFGRRDLERICPDCQNRLNRDIGQGTNIHLSMVGGPSSGKTHFIVTALAELMNRYTAYLFSFSEPRHKTDFEKNIQRLSQGQTLGVTPEIAPTAYTLKVKVPNVPVAKMMYIYDAGGEAYNANERTNLQSYHKHIHGILFIIDPCAISSFHLSHEAEINKISSSLSPCDSEIMQVYDRMLLMLEKKLGLRTRTRYRVPIAVVITKTDALNLEQEIGQSAAQQLLLNDHSYKTEGDAIHQLVQEFLGRYGLSNLLRNFEYQFSTVRYFSCTALGRLPRQADTRSFMPKRTLDPFVWLLMQNGVIKPANKQDLRPSGESVI